MRISDWSSDVCSSDLGIGFGLARWRFAAVSEYVQPELHRITGVTLWKQIRDELEYEILSGIHAPGERLPTENALGARFSVNRHTVRQALHALKVSRLVMSRQGTGVLATADLDNKTDHRRAQEEEKV